MHSFRTIVLLLCPLFLVAGEIRLEVKDPSGAAMEVSGRLVNLASGVGESFRTSAQGAHTFSGLALGRYKLDVAKTGFESQSFSIEVASETAVTRTITLAIGSQSNRVTVVASTPLAGTDQPVNEIPLPVQGSSQADITQSGALELSDFMNRRLNGVHLNELQGNPYQADLNYRGYTASPLLGTPQGLSVYMDGVRLNQPFGDVVSWDLIPRSAIAETTLIPGSNPLFGLNTLGGAISILTKDGTSHPGTSLQASGGSYGRRSAEFEHGGSADNGVNWYLAGNIFHDNGWRPDTPSDVRQLLAKLGWQGSRTVLSLTGAYANNALRSSGIQDVRLLRLDYASIYTKPDKTDNHSPFFNFSARHSPSSRMTFSGNVYYRDIRTRTFNGDINEGSLDQSVYQPGAAERNALTAAGYAGFPTAGANADNTPFPFWRCIGNILIRDEPGEKCNALLNRTYSKQKNWGLAGQSTLFHSGAGTRNQFTVGAAYDRSKVDFSQSTELGYLNPDRSVHPLGAFADGVSAGNVDGVPFDARVKLSGTPRTGSVFATDTLSLASRWSFTFSGRYNRTTIDNVDGIIPKGTGSLTGHHVFDRFNPSAGVTYSPSSLVNTYFNYSEGNRAPTSIELGCADPNQPCKLPNAMAGDPPLQQVVAKTLEAGVRGGGGESKIDWNAGWFRAENRNDILFVSSQQTGFGYFKNFGETRRQGVEAGLSGKISRLTLGGGYTFLDATYQSEETVNGSGNSTNEEALAGRRGLEATIEIEPGNKIPMVPRHMLKAYADLQATSKFNLELSMIALSSSYARGNENNLHKADGVYYMGAGKSPGYAVLNLAGRYQVHKNVQLFGQVSNLANRHYYSAAQLGPTGFTDTGNFIARPFAAINGEFPVRQTTFFAPGSPRIASGGLRFTF